MAPRPSEEMVQVVLQRHLSGDTNDIVVRPVGSVHWLEYNLGEPLSEEDAKVVVRWLPDVVSFLLAAGAIEERHKNHSWGPDIETIRKFTEVQDAS